MEAITSTNDVYSNTSEGMDSGNHDHVNGWTIQTETKTDDADTTTSSRRYFTDIKYYMRHSKYSWICTEVYALLKLAFPLTLSLLFQQSVSIISLIFVGHIPPESLIDEAQYNNKSTLLIDSAAISITTINVTGISVAIGLSTAADTLCSQTYGYKNYKKVGIIFQRGLLILLLIMLFIFCAWLNGESILLLLQQPPCVAKFAGQYMKIYCLGLPGVFILTMLQRYLQSQSIIWPFIISGVISSVLCVILHAIFIFAIPLGLNGAALSLVLVNYCQPIALIVYARITKVHQKTWGGWSWECLEDWGQYFRLGLPGVALICIEWISFEISAFVLGSIGEIELAINTVLINLIVYLFMIPVGLSISSSIRVGNELGAGNPTRARRASYVSIAVIVVIAVSTSAVVEGLGARIGVIFNVEEAVLERLPVMIYLVGALTITDQIQGVMSGTIRGVGHQSWGAAVNVIAYYVIGLPIGMSLTFAAGLKSLGVWIGLGCSSVSQLVGYSIIIGSLKWKKESELAIKRASDKEKIPPSEEREEDEMTNSSTDIDSNGVEVIALKSYTPVSQDEEDITVPEVVNDDSDPLIITSTTPSLDLRKQRHIKLLMLRGSLYLVGIICCVVAGIASQYQPPDSLINGNYSECVSFINDTEWN